MIRAAADTVASMFCDPAAAIIRDGKVRYPLTRSRVSFSVSTRVRGYIGKGKLPRSQADRAGHESSGEDCGRPIQTVGVNWRFQVWLRPRQRHNRRNHCCQAAAREESSCQQKTLHGFRRPGKGVWSSASEWTVRLVQGMYANARSCVRVSEGYRVWSEGRYSPRLGTQPAALHHCAWSLVTRVPL